MLKLRAWLAAACVGLAWSATGEAHAQSIPVVDDCQPAAYLDRTADSADRSFNWDFPFAFDPERCIRIRAGQSVRWVGNFAGHPLDPDQGDTPNPIFAEPGSTGVITFPQPGVFGYRCNFHFEMRGAIHVVPAAPPPTSVPWGTLPHRLILSGVTLGVGLLLLRTRRQRV